MLFLLLLFSFFFDVQFIVAVVDCGGSAVVTSYFGPCDRYCCPKVFWEATDK